MVVARPVRAALAFALTVTALLLFSQFRGAGVSTRGWTFGGGSKPPIREGADGIDPNWESE